MKRRGILLALSLVAVSLPAGADDDQDAARRAVEAGQALPFERILERARRDHPGQFLAAHIEVENGRLIYELRVLGAGGHIGEWRYDARTGEPVEGSHHRHHPTSDRD